MLPLRRPSRGLPVASGPARLWRDRPGDSPGGLFAAGPNLPAGAVAPGRVGRGRSRQSGAPTSAHVVRSSRPLTEMSVNCRAIARMSTGTGRQPGTRRPRRPVQVARGRESGSWSIADPRGSTIDHDHRASRFQWSEISALTLTLLHGDATAACTPWCSAQRPSGVGQEMRWARRALSSSSGWAAGTSSSGRSLGRAARVPSTSCQTRPTAMPKTPWPPCSRS